MRTILFLSSVIFSVFSFAEEITWVENSQLMVDVNCDGNKDHTMIGYHGSNVIVKTKISGSNIESTLTFGIGEPNRQDALCGTEVTLSSYESSTEGLIEIFGEAFPEYKEGPGCYDLYIQAGECDSIHMYWNHTTNQLNWWRL